MSKCPFRRILKGTKAEWEVELQLRLRYFIVCQEQGIKSSKCWDCEGMLWRMLQRGVRSRCEFKGFSRCTRVVVVQ